MTFFIHLKFFYEHVNVFIVIVYLTLRKEIDLLCWVYKKKNSFLSFHPLIFHSKIQKRRGTFWEGGRGDSLKWTYVEGGTCKTNSDKQGRTGLKIGTFERRYFLNDLYSNLTQSFIKNSIRFHLFILFSFCTSLKLWAPPLFHSSSIIKGTCLIVLKTLYKNQHASNFFMVWSHNEK